MVIAAQTPMTDAHRRGQSALLVLGALGVLMLVFLAAAPWILRSYNYAVFVPAIVLSGAITIAATSLAPSLPERWGLIVILAMAVLMRLLVSARNRYCPPMSIATCGMAGCKPQVSTPTRSYRPTMP